MPSIWQCLRQFETVIYFADDVTMTPAEQVLYQNDHVLITRRSRSGGDTVIVKQAFNAEGIRRLAHEADMLERLVHIDGVPRIAEPQVAPDTLLIEDGGSTSLAEYLRGRVLSITAAVSYFTAVARILAQVHKAGVVHKDIAPGNLLIHPETLAPTLIDFNISALASEASSDVVDDQIAGTLAYMSPEHTGRTGRAPDARSDLYSLGVIFYQVLTGRVPFESTDLLDLVHDHLVRVPETPAVLNPDVPAILAALVLRLLEKEPDRRYQSAEGLAQDLARIGAALREGRSHELGVFELGRLDFGTRLAPPAQPIGQAEQRAALLATLDAAADATARRNPTVLVVGPAGVGKTTLLAEVRPWVAARRGWLLQGKFDRFRADGSEGVPTAMRSLGRQLLAEPEQSLAQYRARIREALGRNLGVGPSRLPEFLMVLGEHPAVELTDPREAEARTVQATLAILRGVASAERPVVMILDDLQYAPKLGLILLDALATNEEHIQGLHVVSAYRSNEVAAGHPLHAQIARWHKLSLPATQVEIDNLSESAARALVGEMLRMPDEPAAALAAVLAERTNRNPYATIELLNALRQDGLLVLDEGSWQWQAQAIHRYVGDSNVDDLLGRRIARLPEISREVLRVLACFGGKVDPAMLAQVCAMTSERLDVCLTAAIDDGLLSAPSEASDPVRFAHSRVQQAVLDSMTEEERVALHLALARKLAPLPDAATWAAEQYLHAAFRIEDEAERCTVIDLFSRAAASFGVLESAAAEPMLSAAIEMLAPIAAEQPQRLFELRARQHLALLALGRMEDCDRVYADMVNSGADVLSMAEPTRLQQYTLIHRGRHGDAVAMGLGILSEFGIHKPESLGAAVMAGVGRMLQWSMSAEKDADVTRPEITDPRLVACCSLISGTSTAAFFGDQMCFAWLIVEAHRIWCEHGPAPTVMSTMDSAPFVLAGMPQAYRSAHDVARHLMTIGQARGDGYQLAALAATAVYGVSAGHWIQPVERVVQEVRRAREELRALGETVSTMITYFTADTLFDCGATLDEAASEIEKCMDYCRATGNETSQIRFIARRQMVRALRGLTRAVNSLSDDAFDEAQYVEVLNPNDSSPATYYSVRSIQAMIYGDLPALLEHTAKAISTLPRLPGAYLWSQVYAARGLALSMQALSLPPAEREPVIAEFDATCLQWYTARAADAPHNFLHLLRWLQAERAWFAGTVWEAGIAFDAAVAEARLHPRPWHLALILERAALFRLAHGMEADARPILAEACGTYDAWGAAGKVKELKRQHAFLRSSAGLSRTDSVKTTMLVGTEVLDLMAVLRASQALSSETSLSRLTDRVGKVLRAITGATGVQLVVRPEEGSTDWVLAHTLDSGSPRTVEQAAAAGELALSAFRYAERTGELLCIDDVVRDERFAADPFARELEVCSLLFSPVLKQGHLHAMLVLTNRQRRNAFSGDRLDSLALIAGQLSVSLDNALLYASLERRVAERTVQLRQKTSDINAMLQNMSQGVLTVVAGGTVHPEYSAYLATILETSDIAGAAVMALLFSGSNLGADALSQIDVAIASIIGEDEMNFEFNAHLLVSEFDKAFPDGRVKSLALSWSPICDDAGMVVKLMLCLRDVTELKLLTAEAGERRRELQMIGEILAITQEKFQEFIDSAREFLAANYQLIEKTAEKKPEVINLLFRNMHTIKGNARTYGLQGLTDPVHEAEQSYDDLRKNPDSVWNAPALLAELAVLSKLIDAYAHVNDSVLGRKGPGRRAGVEKFLMVERDTVARSVQLLMGVDQNDPAAMREALEQVGSTLHLLGTASLGEVLETTLESLPSLAQELGKAPPQVHIEDHGIVVRSQVSSLLKDLFTHLLRNAVDHGLETPQERQAAGKPAVGRISLDVRVDDGKLWIYLTDDGRGLAVAKIRQRAMEQNLLTRGAHAYAGVSAEELAQLIFRSGFSTAERVTAVSGRGVGMDAVRAFLEKEDGSIAIRFLDSVEDAEFRPFQTVISLPDKFAASMHAAMSFDALRARLAAKKSFGVTAG